MAEPESATKRTQTQRLDDIETALSLIQADLQKYVNDTHTELDLIGREVNGLAAFLQALNAEFRPLLDRYKRAADAGSTFATLRQMRKDAKQ